MATASQVIAAGFCAALLVSSTATGAWGQAGAAAPSGGGQSGTPPGSAPGRSFGGDLERPMLTGRVVCVGCSLEQAQEANPNLSNLYEFTREQDRLVVQADTIADRGTWDNTVGLSHQVPVRAPDQIWQALTAKENVHKEVVVGGLLSNNRMLDINQISIAGKVISALEEGAPR
jgi:hypothetical protein